MTQHQPVIALTRQCIMSRRMGGGFEVSILPGKIVKSSWQSVTLLSASRLTNKMVREKLSGSPVLARRTDKQCAAKISRYLRLLRAHGILRKEPSQNRYQLTLKGARLTNLLQGILAVSTENLMKMAA